MNSFYKSKYIHENKNSIWLFSIESVSARKHFFADEPALKATFNYMNIPKDKMYLSNTSVSSELELDNKISIFFNYTNYVNISITFFVE